MTAAICLLVLLTSTALDYAHTRYVQAVELRAAHAAAAWSVVQWIAASIGFVAAIRFSLWVLPFEAAGLYLGTLLAVKKHASRVPGATIARCDLKSGTTSERSAPRA